MHEKRSERVSRRNSGLASRRPDPSDGRTGSLTQVAGRPPRRAAGALHDPPAGDQRPIRGGRAVSRTVNREVGKSPYVLFRMFQLDLAQWSLRANVAPYT
jgi:hypothetical protein